MDLGIKVLKHPDFVIQGALYSNKEISLAAHELLRRWAEEQYNRRKAYINLHAGLRKCEMKQLAAELKLWVEEGTSTLIPGTSDERRLQSKLTYERITYQD